MRLWRNPRHVYFIQQRPGESVKKEDLSRSDRILVDSAFLWGVEIRVKGDRRALETVFMRLGSSAPGSELGDLASTKIGSKSRRWVRLERDEGTMRTW